MVTDMDFIPGFIRDFLDWLMIGVLTPLFSTASHFLQVLIITPLDAIGAPLWMQVTLVALLTAGISLFIRKLLRVDEKEEAFRQAFLARQQAQELIKEIDDWKKQSVLYDASDSELDEKFNEYLAQRFARYGITYLMPVFFALFWLDHIPSVVRLKEETGAVFVISFPSPVRGISGISLPLLFMTVYLLVIFLYFKFRPRRKIENIQVPNR